MERIHETVPPEALLQRLQSQPAPCRRPLPLVPHARHPVRFTRTHALGRHERAAWPRLSRAVVAVRRSHRNPLWGSSILWQYGALPWRRARGGTIEVLLVTSRRRGCWIVPKGWLVTGCTPAQSAAREAFEEAGVVGIMGSEPIGTYRHVRSDPDGSDKVKNVSIYALRVVGTLHNWPEQGRRRRDWFRIDEAPSMIEQAGLARLCCPSKLRSEASFLL